MDTQIPQEILSQRRRKRILKTILYSGAGVLVLVIFAVILRGGISASDIKVSQAEIGSIEISVSSFGKVRPLREEVITSPVATIILETFRKIGDILEQ